MIGGYKLTIVHFLVKDTLASIWGLWGIWIVTGNSQARMTAMLCFFEICRMLPCMELSYSFNRQKWILCYKQTNKKNPMSFTEVIHHKLRGWWAWPSAGIKNERITVSNQHKELNWGRGRLEECGNGNCLTALTVIYLHCSYLLKMSAPHVNENACL